MPTQQDQMPINMQSLSFLPLGGMETVTRNMYLYQYSNEVLIVDCGLGFADESMLGIDLVLPDISYLLDAIKPSSAGSAPTKVGSAPASPAGRFGGKRIVGMVLTHGHEDHIGALPFILPQLPSFPLFGSQITAAFSNEKLKEFQMTPSVKAVNFDGGAIQLGSFSVSFIHITHSVPDTANIFIKTPVGNFYHGSDFKFDFTPFDGKRTDFAKIVGAGQEGITSLMTDSLGAERAGYTASEQPIGANLERVIRECKGKCLITTYSSHIARLNQAIAAAENANRRVCFVGRSMIKIKNIAQKLGYLRMKAATEVPLEALKKFPDKDLVLLVAGSQGQANSALTRIAINEFKEVQLRPDDVVVFSSDPIPGKEQSISLLVDAIIKRGTKVVSSHHDGAYHVSGHGSSMDHMLMMSLTKPQNIVPISGTYFHMNAYKELALKMGYTKEKIHLLENGQELLFSRTGVRYGKRIPMRNIYVDEVSGEEVESYVLRDREKLGKEGIVIILCEIDSTTGQLFETPEIVARGFSQTETKEIGKLLALEIRKVLAARGGKVSNWIQIRKLIEETGNRVFDKKLRRKPLILPVTIEV